MKLVAASSFLLAAVYANLIEEFTLLVFLGERTPHLRKTLGVPGYFGVTDLDGPGEKFKGPGENFKLTENMELVDSDLVRLIVDRDGELREAVCGDEPTTGFYFDSVNNLKLNDSDWGQNFYACKKLELGMLELRVGYLEGCSQVDLVKDRADLSYWTVWDFFVYYTQ